MMNHSLHQGQEIGCYEAKTHLSEFLERVSRGERFVITRHGAPIAALIPLERPTQAGLEAALKALELFQKEHPLEDIAISELINTGRKY